MGTSRRPIRGKRTASFSVVMMGLSTQRLTLVDEVDDFLLCINDGGLHSGVPREYWRPGPRFPSQIPPAPQFLKLR